MQAETVIFYAISAAIVVAALCVVTLRNLMHSAVSLIACLFGVAALYLLLDADFLAAVQVMLYVGGVTVLILFVVMLTYRLASPAPGKVPGQSNEQAGLAIAVAAGTLALLGWVIAQTADWHGTLPAWPAGEPRGITAKIGHILLSEALLPFEVASVLLLAAMVGAIVLSRADKA